MAVLSRISIIVAGSAVLCAQQTAAPTYVAVVSGADTHITGTVINATDGVAAASGAKIESAKHNASLKLTRGGSLTLCQSSVIGLDARGSQLFMALQAGTMEAEYPLSAAADNLLTADYRISVISGSGLPGQSAAYRVGIGQKGDVLIQVMPTSQSYLIVASNFDNAQSVVRPGEIRGFPALGSSLTPEQITSHVPLRCPVETKPETNTLVAAATEAKTPSDSLQVPLAYRSPELPVSEKTPPAVAKNESAAPPAPVAAVVPASAPLQAAAPMVTAPSAVKAAKSGNAFTRFFRRIFGSKT